MNEMTAVYDEQVKYLTDLNKKISAQTLATAGTTTNSLAATVDYFDGTCSFAKRSRSPLQVSKRSSAFAAT